MDETQEVSEMTEKFNEVLLKLTGGDPLEEYTIFTAKEDGVMCEYIICRYEEKILVVQFEAESGLYVNDYMYSKELDGHSYHMMACLMFEVKENLRMATELYGDGSNTIWNFEISIGNIQKSIFVVLLVAIVYYLVVLFM